MIRPTRSRDLPAVAGLYRRVWHETHGCCMPRPEREARDARFFLSRMEGLMPNVVVGEDRRTIIGFAAWKDSRLGQLFLDAAARNSGLGRRLIERAERGLRDQGARETELHCLVGNERAKRFHERVGWRVRDIVTEPVKGDGDAEARDFWVMRKPLVGGTVA